MTDTLPEGHPVPWDELAPHERQQGGYWLYPPGCDVYGNGRVWVSVPRPKSEERQQPRMTFVSHQQGELMDARKDLYALVMQGNEHSPANSERASEKIDAYRAKVLRLAAEAVEQEFLDGITDSDQDQTWNAAVRAIATALRQSADKPESQDG